MRVLAVDFGERRLGLAVSDESGQVVLPIGTIARRSDLQAAGAVAEAARERAVGRIVVGHPLNADGTEGAFARRARNFAKKLSELAGLPVDLHGEGLTSHAAEWNLIEAGVRGGRRDALRDAESAAVLLRDFLFERDSRPRTG
ncbi:MAG TPA: Holliday junction resolvase RuvX [Thermoanaerobaculia bacterium]|nr:Holliday junction resolvase RuvX [Thermoanaerobaculia bacterium]